MASAPEVTASDQDKERRRDMPIAIRRGVFLRFLKGRRFRMRIFWRKREPIDLLIEVYRKEARAEAKEARKRERSERRFRISSFC